MGNCRHYRRRRTKRRMRGCKTKKRYGSEIAAMRVAVRFGQTWYRCPYCHGFHLTSKKADVTAGRQCSQTEGGSIEGATAT